MDWDQLNFKSPVNGSAFSIQPRLFFLITGGPAGGISNPQPVGKITINVNWEGIPSATQQDIEQGTVASYPKEFDRNFIINVDDKIIKYIVKNNLVVTRVNQTQDGSDFGRNEFIDLVRKGIL
jgi:hypothetical protein